MDGWYADECTYARVGNAAPAIVAAPANATAAQSAAALGLFGWPPAMNMGELPGGGSMPTSLEELPQFFERQVCSIGSFIYGQEDSWLRSNHHLYFTDGTAFHFIGLSFVYR